jgi:hypothetical protein
MIKKWRSDNRQISYGQNKSVLSSRKNTNKSVLSTSTRIIISQSLSGGLPARDYTRNREIKQNPSWYQETWSALPQSCDQSQHQQSYILWQHALLLCYNEINSRLPLWYSSQTLIQCFYYYYCCAGWRYIGIFTKVLTMYQIYNTWVHPLHCSLSSPLQLLEQLQQVLFLHLLTCIYLICTTSLLLQCCQPPPQSEPVLPSCSLIL